MWLLERSIDLMSGISVRKNVAVGQLRFFCCCRCRCCERRERSSRDLKWVSTGTEVRWLLSM